MKKLIILILIMVFTTNLQVFADDEIEENHSSEDILQILETSSNIGNEIKINSRAAVVIDRTTGAVLYGKNENQQRPMASTTKIMTRPYCN